MKTKTADEKKMKKLPKGLIKKVRERYNKFTSYLMERILRYDSLEDVPEQYFYYLERVKRYRKISVFPNEVETVHIHPKPLRELDDIQLERFVRHVLRDKDEEVITHVINKLRSKKKKKKVEFGKIMTEDIPRYEKIKQLKSYLMDIGRKNKKMMLKKIFEDEEVLDLLGIDLKMGDRFSRPYLIAKKIYEILSIKVTCKLVYQMLQNKVEMEKPLFKDYETYNLIKTFVENNPDKYNGKSGRCVLAADLKTQLGIRLSKDTLKIKLTQMMKRGELPYTGWPEYSPKYVVRNNRMKFLRKT